MGKRLKVLCIHGIAQNAYVLFSCARVTCPDGVG